jgi:hypothetical protein
MNPDFKIIVTKLLTIYGSEDTRNENNKLKNEMNQKNESTFSLSSGYLYK